MKRFICLLGLLCLLSIGCKKSSTGPSNGNGMQGQYKIAFVSMKGGNDIGIYVMNSDSTNKIRLTDTTNTCLYPEWSSDGRRIVYVQHPNGGYKVSMMNSDGTNDIRLSIDAGDDWDERPTWSPDGSKIVFAAPYQQFTGNAIFVMGADGTDQTLLAPGSAPNWSTDGKKISYLYSDSDELYVMNADGSNKLQLTNEVVRYPSWSSDGSKIAFAAVRNGKYDIFTINSDGTNQLQLTDDPNDDKFPGWHPDGTKIVFVSDRNGSAEVYIMQFDGTNQLRLTNDSNFGFSDWFRNNYALWSPDGELIVFSSYGANGVGIGLINSDGTNQQRLTTGLDLYPRWSPVRLP